MKVGRAPGHPSQLEPADRAGPGSEDADVELASRAAAGDARAFRGLYDAHFDFVFRTCRRLGLAEADAEDAVQETFAVAHRKLGTFRAGRLSTWLFRIAANVVSARHRRRRVREALFSLWGGGRDEQAPLRPDEAAEQQEAARQVGALLARLAPKKREVFALFELEGLSGEEVAERVGCSVATVWTRLHHARREFAALAQRRGLTVDEGEGGA